MNWISGSTIASILLITAGCGAPESEAQTGERVYEIAYHLTAEPSDQSLTVDLTLNQDRRLLREMSFELDEAALLDASGGAISFEDGRIKWQPDEKGGSLRWRVKLANRRGDGGYDALLTKDWGLFRAEDAIPRAATRAVRGAESATTLAFRLPAGWSAVTEYSSLQDPITVTRPDRRFSQPTGWITIGNLGVRRETISGTRVTIAGPAGYSVRRMDMLALLNWTLPELSAIAGKPLERLTIVSAGDPMWRGGLSAPASAYIHADRPLISENATSTLVHEVVHIALGLNVHPRHDWIVEGLAEYYSLNLLHRGGAITTRRHTRALQDQQEWSQQANALCEGNTSGPTTALAVVVLRNLDQKIRKAAPGKSLDDVVIALQALDIEIDTATLMDTAGAVAGDDDWTFDVDNLSNCLTIAMDLADQTMQWTDITTST